MRLPLDPQTGWLFHFDESKDSQVPVDMAGQVTPLQQPAILGGRPTVTAGARAGHGARKWNNDPPGQGFVAFENVIGGGRFTRDATIEGIVHIPWDSGPSDGTEYRLVTRGSSSGSAAETELYGLSIITIGPAGARTTSLQMRWQEVGGATATVPAVTILNANGWLYVAAVRRWISTTSVEVSYYLNGAPLGVVTSAQGNIGDGAAGTLMIGCTLLSGGSGLPDGSIIDEICGSPVARSAEEMRWRYNYALVFGDYGYDLVRSLQPPGEAWTRDTSSRIQQLFQVAGDALGIAWAKAAELLDDFLPDRAWSFLDRWESVTRLAPTPGDSIATRRARVVGFLRKVQGFTRDQILEAVVGLLAAAVADLQLLEVSNTWLDEFTGSSLGLRWRDETVTGSITVGSGHATLAAVTGNHIPWDAATVTPIMARTTVPAELGVEVACELTSLTLGEDGAACGIFLSNRVTGEALMWGIKRQGGVNKWWKATLLAGVLTETYGLATGAGTSFWLRYVDRSDLFLGTADLTYQVDGTTYDGPWVSLVNIAAMSGPRNWAGIFMLDATNPVVTGSSVHVESFRLYAPDSRQVFNWYLYRDPGLGGAPDLAGAQLIVDKMTPAHESGHVTTAVAVLFDDANSVFDRTPLGA